MAIALTSVSVELDRAVLALAEALDFVGVDSVGHGHRVGLMAAMVAEELGWEPAAVRAVVRAGLLHDCGVSTTREHRHLVNELEWEGSQGHCRRGADYVGSVPVLADMAEVIREHHSHWNDLMHRQVPESVARPANLLFLVDRADALKAHGVAIGRPMIDILRRHHDFFAPDLLAAFDEVARREAFWFVQEPPALGEEITGRLREGPQHLLSLAEIRDLATMFGRIIDAKSAYTERHSVGVGKVARLLGELLGMAGDEVDCLEIAGMLHDLGKLRIPDELLEKQGPLTTEERMRMARHAFDTWEVLRHLFGEGPIAQWAAWHHESVSGGGYPFHRQGEQLPLGARVVAVADVVQALAQERPYRAPLTGDEIAALLDGMVFAGKLDKAVVDCCKAHMDACWRAAVESEQAA